MSEDPVATKGRLTLKRDVLAVVPSDTLFDLHAFGLTDKHIVYVETSPQFESAVLIANALLGRLQMLQTLCDWQDGLGNPSAHIVVMERATGEWKRYQIDGPVGKVEHFVGSYDQPSGDGIVIDFLSEVPGNGAAFPASSELVRLIYHTNESAALLNQRMIRCILPTGDSQKTSSSAKCREIGNGLRFGPFVTMNSNFYRKPYKFAYLTFPNMSSELGLSDGVVKFDVDQERIVASSYSSFAAGRYVVNEPRFIPRGDAEDDALLVVTMHDTLEDRSHQAVFDTQDMSLIGTYDFGAPNDVDSAGRMRVAFHGMHCPFVGDGPCLRL
jgi:carotenoid cleavage dioxygenase-like enzyme